MTDKKKCECGCAGSWAENVCIAAVFFGLLALIAFVLWLTIGG